MGKMMVEHCTTFVMIRIPAEINVRSVLESGSSVDLGMQMCTTTEEGTISSSITWLIYVAANRSNCKISSILKRVWCQRSPG